MTHLAPSAKDQQDNQRNHTVSGPSQLTAYVDDSGSDGQAAHFILAGYVATPERWSGFTTAWRDMLSSGPLPLEYIKGTEAAGFRHQFSKWSRQDRDAKLHEAVDLIASHAEFAVITTLSRANYDEIVRSYVAAREDVLLAGAPLFNSGYGPYFELLTDLIAALVRQGIDRRACINFVMDSQPEKEKLARSLFNVQARQMAEHFGGPRGAAALGAVDFATEQSAPPLQAADLLAWHVNRHLEKARIEGPRTLFTKLTQVPTLWFRDNPVTMRLARRQHAMGIDPYTGKPFEPSAGSSPS